MQWQCEIPQSFYGGFDGMPWHCQNAAILAAGTKLPWEHESTTTYVVREKTMLEKITDYSIPTVDSLFEKLMKVSRNSTHKPNGESGDNDPESEGNRKKRRSVVNITSMPSLADETLNDNMAENGGDDDEHKRRSRFEIYLWAGAANSFLDKNPDCENLFNKLLQRASEITGKQLKSNNIRDWLSEWAKTGYLNLGYHNRTNSGAWGSVGDQFNGLDREKKGWGVNITATRNYVQDYISNVPVKQLAGASNLTTLLHELFHAVSRGFGDDVAAQIVEEMGYMKMSYKDYENQDSVKKQLKDLQDNFKSTQAIPSYYWAPVPFYVCGSTRTKEDK